MSVLQRIYMAFINLHAGEHLCPGTDNLIGPGEKEANGRTAACLFLFSGLVMAFYRVN